jgi:hypothetical protein
MKKNTIFALILISALILAMSLSACDGEKPADSQTADSQTSESELSKQETFYWENINFGQNLSYGQEYTITGDSGDYVNAAESAKLTFDCLKENAGIPGYSDTLQYKLTLTDIGNINGDECYVYRLDLLGDTVETIASYAYCYQSELVYKYTDDGGTELIGGEDSDDDDWIVNEPIAEGVIFKGSLLKSDPADGMTPYDAASGLYNLVLKSKLNQGTDYSKEEPMLITCVDVKDIEGAECYLLSVSGAFNTKAWEYAVESYTDKQNVYSVSETGNTLLGSLLDLD